MRECAAILSLMCSCLIGAPPALAFAQCGTASWYGAHGDHNAAHRFLPIGSKVHVENLDNGHKITVEINTADRLFVAALLTYPKPPPRSSTSRPMGLLRC